MPPGPFAPKHHQPYATLKTLPRSLVSPGRSGFALIEPGSGLYHHYVNVPLISILDVYVCVSYVWSEWKRRPTDDLPDWSRLRATLRAALSGVCVRQVSDRSTCCWVDSKCIDQASDADKRYWIPRMAGIYGGAVCTVLLLPDSTPSLAGLSLAADALRCSVGGWGDRHHDCLMMPSCCASTIFTPLQVEGSLVALRALARGAWRRRAWIYQEVVMSRRYFLSGTDGIQVSLDTAGIVAALLSQRSRQHRTELTELYAWIRGVYHVKAEFHAALSNPTSVAVVLQAASSLEATIPADKYYALLSVLRLTGLEYVKEHSASRALFCVIRSFVGNNDLSWAYAFPPSTAQGALCLDAERLTRLLSFENESSTRLGGIISNKWQSVTRKRGLTINESSLTVSAVLVGWIRDLRPVWTILQEAVNAEATSVGDDGIHSSIAIATAVIQCLAGEVLNPALTSQPTKALQRVFNDGKQLNRLELIWLLYTCDLRALEERFDQAADEEFRWALQMARATAESLQTHIDQVEGDFVVVYWSDPTLESRITRGKEHLCHISLGHMGCLLGAYVWKYGKHLLAAAPKSNSGESYVSAAWQGMLFPISDVQASCPASFTRSKGSVDPATMLSADELVLQFTVQIDDNGTDYQ